MSEPQAQPQTQETPSSRLRADYVNQLNGVNQQLTNLENERQRLVSYREQLKGAVFALDQLDKLQSAAASSDAQPATPAASSDAQPATPAAQAPAAQ